MVFKTSLTQGGLAQVVERSICIREAPGSIPGFSTFHSMVENGYSQTLTGGFITFCALFVVYVSYFMNHCFCKTAETRD